MGTYSRFLFVLGILAVSLFTLLPNPVHSDSYTIYFESERDGEIAIYQLDGDNVERFTDFGCKHPSVTADDSMLIYTRLVDTNWGQYWNAFYFVDGEEHKLTRNEIHDELEPVISHDGTFAAYSSLRGTISSYDQQDNQNMEIFTLSLVADDYQYRITESPKPDEYPMLASGSEWVYFTGRTGNFSYILRAPGEGGEAERITEDTLGWEEHASISADGRYIAYASVVEFPDEDEDVDEEADSEEISNSGHSSTSPDSSTAIPANINPDTNVIPGILPYPGMAAGGTYTPVEEDVDVDEDELGEEAETDDEYSREGNADIWILDIETGERTQITFNDAWDGNPTISADGEVIVFTSDRDGNYEIYRINVDGSGLERLTFDDGTDDFATIT